MKVSHSSRFPDGFDISGDTQEVIDAVKFFTDRNWHVSMEAYRAGVGSATIRLRQKYDWSKKTLTAYIRCMEIHNEPLDIDPEKILAWIEGRPNWQ